MTEHHEITVQKVVSTGQLLVKYPCEFFTYKNQWDETKEKLNITDEELREKIEQCLQMWAWADILEDVRADMEELEEKKE